MTDKIVKLNSDNELVAENPDTEETEPVTFGMLALPTASEGDEAPSDRAVAIDPNEGVILVPEEDSA